MKKCWCEKFGRNPQDPCCPESYAQYGTIGRYPSGNYLSFYEVFRKGTEISLEEDQTIVLQPGYLYLIDYVFLATTGSQQRLQILPYINQQPGLLYSVFSISGNEDNVSTAASFTTNAAWDEAAQLEFRVTAGNESGTVTADLQGAVSVTPLIRKRE